MSRTNVGAEGSALSTQAAINAARSRKGYEPYEDALFEAGDTGRVLDINTDLEENAHSGYIMVDASAEATPELGDLQVEFAEGDGAAYGSIMTIRNGTVFPLDGMDIDKIRLTHTGTNCSYYAFAKKA